MRRRFEHGDDLRLGDTAVIPVHYPNANLLAGNRSVDIDGLALGFAIGLARQSDVGELKVEDFGGRRPGTGEVARTLLSHLYLDVETRKRPYALGRGLAISFWASLPTN
jgi:hypothetical protein